MKILHVVSLVGISSAMLMNCGCGEKKSEIEEHPAVRLSLLYPEGTLFHRAAERWAERAWEASGGAIAIEVHGGGKLLTGTGKDQASLLSSGGAELALVRPWDLRSLAPSLEILYLPFLFPNRRSADAVLGGETGKKLFAGLEEKGIKGLGFFSGPFYQLSSTKRVVCPEDLRGMKVRMPQSRDTAVDREAMKSLGVRSMTIPASMLEKKTEDGDIDGMLSTAGFYDREDLVRIQPYLCDLNYSFEPLAACASNEFWNRLDPGKRKILLSTFLEASRFFRDNLNEEEVKKKVNLDKKGATIIEFIPKELERFRDAVEKNCVKAIPGISLPLLARIKGEIEKSRAPALFRMCDNLKNARITVPSCQPELSKNEFLDIDSTGSILVHGGDAILNDDRYGIFCPVPSAIEYDLTLPDNPKLEFSLCVRPDAALQYPNGVTFRISIRRGSGEQKKIFEKLLLPATRASDRKWFDESVGIDGEKGEKVTVVFETLEPRGAESVQTDFYYGAVWGNPVIYEVDKSAYVRNIILISMDTLGAARLHCYGNPRRTSPSIDRLAERGTRFVNCIPQAGYTLPSHMAMMTSLYPDELRLFSPSKVEKFEPAVLTLAEFLRDCGYNTCAFTEGVLVDSVFGFAEGFNQYNNIYSTDVDMTDSSFIFNDAVNKELIRDEKVRRIQTTFGRAIQFIKERGQRKFFLFIHSYQVHTPYYPNPYVKLFSPRYKGKISSDGNYSAETEKQLLSGNLKREDIAQLYAVHDAQVRFADDFVGKLVVELKKLGIENNTLIIFTADHGERIFSHGEIYGHGGLPTEEVVRVPLVLDGDPIVPRGKRIAQQVELVDLGPTMTDFASGEVPPVFRGISLYNTIVKNAPLPDDRIAYIEHTYQDRNFSGRLLGIRTKDEKFIFNPYSGEKKLYNLKSDPGELNDVSELNPDEVVRFAGQAKSYFAHRAWGYFFSFYSKRGVHIFEGDIKVRGRIEWVDAFSMSETDVLEMGRYKASRLKFKIKVTPGEEKLLNFHVLPFNAEVTLSLIVDGEPDWRHTRDFVFLGDDKRPIPSMPWEFDNSIISKANPFTAGISRRSGLYITQKEPDFFADDKTRTGLKSAGEAGFAKEEKKEARSGWDVRKQQKKMKDLREKLKALGYIK